MSLFTREETKAEYESWDDRHLINYAGEGLDEWHASIITEVLNARGIEHTWSPGWRIEVGTRKSPQTPVTRYAVVNLADPENPVVVGFWDGNLFADADAAKAQASSLNRAMKPDFQTYTVATLTFDTEV